MRPGLWQIVLVIVLIFILFGSSKIPDMMKNLAGGRNGFKKELKADKSQEAPKKAPAAKPAVKKPAAVKSAVKKASVKKTTAKKAPVKKPVAKKTAKK